LPGPPPGQQPPHRLPFHQRPPPVHRHKHDRVHVVARIVVVPNVDVGNVVVVVVIVVIIVIVVVVDVVDNVGGQRDGPHGEVHKGESGYTVLSRTLLLLFLFLFLRLPVVDDESTRLRPLLSTFDPGVLQHYIRLQLL